MKKKILVLIIIVMMMGFQACTTTNGPEQGVKVIADTNSGKDIVTRKFDKVSILGGDLQSSETTWWGGIKGKGNLSIERVGSSVISTGNLETWLMIRNRTENHHQIEVRTSYFDAQGRPLDDVTEWTRVHLSPNVVQTHRSFSIKPASDYYIEIRRAQ